MTDALALIELYFEEFRRSVDRCRSATSFRPEDWRDAYNALARLRDRYNHEKASLPAKQRATLQKVLENYRFIEGMMAFRNVGEHVIEREGPLIYTIGNEPIQLTADSSAMAVFAGRIVTLKDTDGVAHRIDHLERLEAAERHVGAALDASRASDRKDSTPHLRQEAAALRDFDPANVAERKAELFEG